MAVEEDAHDCISQGICNGAPQPKKVVRRLEVEIPITVLGKQDCPEPLHIPAQEPLPIKRELEVRVPRGWSPGQVLAVPLGASNVQLHVPEGCKEEDAICMMQRSDDTWRIVRKTTQFSFLIPENSTPGVQLRLHLPDGHPLVFTVSEGMEPGMLVSLKSTQSDDWALEKVSRLPDPSKPVPVNDTVRGPYEELLQVIARGERLNKLPRDVDGTLKINVPFCGLFREHAILGDFLDQHCDFKVDILGADSCMEFACDLAISERCFQYRFQKSRLVTRLMDLSQDALPDAGLVMGIHPEVTKGGAWFQIVASALNCGRAGLTVFATFYECEMQTILNMVEMFTGDKERAEVIENPYYKEHDLPEPPPMRYIIMVDRVGSTSQ